MKFHTLENIASSCIYQAFIQAFSDYQVPMEMPLEAFETMLKRNGFSSEVSVGAFENGVLVGFILNGARNWEGVKTIYDLGTAVVPDFRRKGVTSGLLELVKKLCIEKHIDRYQLEVIQDNESAVVLYKEQGFRIDRALNCYSMENKRIELDEYKRCTLLHPERLQAEQWEQVKHFWNYPPSWQNSIESVNAIADAFFYTLAEIDGQLAGYGVAGKTRGDVVQLAVNPEYRRMGVATEILADLQKQAATLNMRAVNVDDRDKMTDAFLKKMGFDVFVKQYEMKSHLQ